ncbi:membrane-targeted effector domain-containing toxin [Pseudomonas rubra]|uniref:Membrane-targeted effector domain-containing toxin n=1 Tax=Pseudomonas rubra TaxID=2942627 RepID=A0ABT5P7G6_9PSED|nr:membrane-targeted effector domain-containing toxin [Pseudomonas rubra]MDD1014232.1 membrane-targeted effector domain-containing toxin [Pseudomonas rubra]MDD1037653.1 membrane-targeted effector domain-containing toxin [Pseudomonas rubra]MDD1155749.1 membrane-targeted effector domain-containing toxin [Pseudomonas rubra]
MNTTSDSNTLQAPLSQFTSQVMRQLPDLHLMAWQAARRILASMKVEGDPDKIYWHRFDNAQSSSTSFTGWEHVGAPEESMTLTELVIRRFRVADQDNADVLHNWGGFYQQGPQAQRYDQRNEVRLSPSSLLQALWQVDFSSVYRKALQAFWKTSGDDLRTVVRLNILAAGTLACESGQLTRLQLHWVIQALGVERPMALRLQDVAGLRPAQGELSVSCLRFAGHDLVNILWFSHPSGRQILYVPGGAQVFETFQGPEGIYGWLRSQVTDKAARKQLASYGEVVSSVALAQRIARFKRIAQGTDEQLADSVERRAVSADLCDWLVRQTQARMAAEADLQLRSNADLRKQLWIGYLGAGLQLATPVAMLSWPVAVAVILAGVAKLGLNIDQAVNARDPQERQAALVGAIVSGVELVLNLTLLLPGAIPADEELAVFKAPLAVPPTEPAIPSAQGILTGEQGQYIRLQGGLYRVRYDASLKTWLVIDPGNPFAFHGNFPVRLNAQLRWELIESACLRGGGQCLGSLGSRHILPGGESAGDLVLGRYHVPAQQRSAVSDLLKQSNRRMLAGDFYDPESVLNPVLDDFLLLRARLTLEAEQYIDSLPRLSRSTVPAPDPQLSALLSFQRLYDDAQGVVIGESHQAIGSKRFLIKHMKALALGGVDTLYMEHLLTDLHQTDLEVLLRDGKMSARLRDYLRELDEGHFTDSTAVDTFYNVVWEATRRGIRIIALDCAASYRLDGLDLQEVLRQKVFSYYASRIIQATRFQPGAGKWVAFVGDSHASTYKGVPGLAQLEDVVSVRIVDAGQGQHTEMTLDPGEWYIPSMGRPQGVVKADWRLALKVRERPFEFLDPSLAPPGVLQP